MPDLPFVTAVCVTGKDEFSVRNLLPAAVECFHKQSYPADRRALLVVYDDHFDAVQEHLDGCIGLPCNKSNLGSLRNQGLEAIHKMTSKDPLKNYCIQWDCDDWHHPQRIAAQVNACSQGHRASFLQRQLCWSLTTNTAFIREYSHMPIHGTICHRVPCKERYPATEKGEDTAFFSAWSPRCCVLDNDPRFYVRIEHGHNTWDAAHIMRGYAGEWAVGKWHLCHDHSAFLTTQVLPHYDNLLGDDN
jgi:glycosyltransferase involved in cell wall biosynthesis